MHLYRVQTAENRTDTPSSSLFRSGHRSTTSFARVLQRKNRGIDQKYRKSWGGKYGVKQHADFINAKGFTECSIISRDKIGEFFGI